jgi:hypothetical protein
VFGVNSFIEVGILAGKLARLRTVSRHQLRNTVQTTQGRSFGAGIDLAILASDLRL